MISTALLYIMVIWSLIVHFGQFMPNWLRIILTIAVAVIFIIAYLIEDKLMDRIKHLEIEVMKLNSTKKGGK